MTQKQLEILNARIAKLEAACEGFELNANQFDRAWEKLIDLIIIRDNRVMA